MDLGHCRCEPVDREGASPHAHQSPTPLSNRRCGSQMCGDPAMGQVTNHVVAPRAHSAATAACVQQ